VVFSEILGSRGDWVENVNFSLRYASKYHIRSLHPYTKQPMETFELSMYLSSRGGLCKISIRWT